MTQTLHSLTSKRISRVNFLSRREIAELPNLLMPDEQILGIVSGFYSTGPATLCVTSRRLLLVDKKLIRLNYEDIRFEAIKEVSYSHQAIMASVRFFYAGRVLQFKSWYKNELRGLAQFSQHRMFEIKEEKDTSKRPPEEAKMIDQFAEYAKAQIKDVPLTETPKELEPTQAQPQEVSYQRSDAPLTYQAGPQLEHYISQRVARWRRASRFIDSLPSANPIRAKEDYPVLPTLRSLRSLRTTAAKR